MRICNQYDIFICDEEKKDTVILYTTFLVKTKVVAGGTQRYGKIGEG